MNDTNTVRDYDVVVIGAGPAGLTAGMYTARQGLSTVIVGGEVGGQAAWTSEIENYLGWRLVTGKELVQNFRDHVSQFDVECLEGQLVNAIIPGDDGFEIFTREGESLKARAIIIGTGRAPNRLAVPGEQEFVGRGGAYCATCDAAFFKGRPVVVVGPGESAADAALELSALGAFVTVINMTDLKVPDTLKQRMDEAENLEVRTGVKIVEIVGDERVSGVKVQARGSQEIEDIPAEGVFIETGAIAASEFTGGLVEMDERGQIITAKDGATNVPGIYAAGDVTDVAGKQIIIAAGQGANAAIAVSRYLKRR